MKSSHERKMIIIGAGFSGICLAREVRQKNHDVQLMAFLDDDLQKIGSIVEGTVVHGPISAIKDSELEIDEAVIAIPSAPKQRLREIYRILVDTEIPVIRILPAISQIIDGEAHLVLTREIDPQDLLGRDPVQIALKHSLGYLRGKRVLITGAGGSIGSELARQLLSCEAQRLYLLGHGEDSIYQIDKELRTLQLGGVGEEAVIVPVIGDLKDAYHLDFLLQRMKVDVIFHAAAHKHVPMLEANPVEAVSNNIFGTRHLVDAAVKAGVEKVILVSTDKAVEPHSVYGVTKKVCEDLVLLESTRTRITQFMVVRFGNVLGSRGSIVPLFREQILAGGPLTITDKGASRYFMTISEAASLVLQAAGVGQGGQLYLLDMGEPLLIEDLAVQIIKFYGKVPYHDIAIQYIGLRPGEKLKESLYAPYENPVPTEYARINRLIRHEAPLDVDCLLALLYPICFFCPTNGESYRNRRELRLILSNWVPTLKEIDEPEY